MRGSLSSRVNASLAEYERFSALTTEQKIQTLKLDSIRDKIAADLQAEKDRKPAESADQ
jgi:hypothetical protein